MSELPGLFAVLGRRGRVGGVIMVVLGAGLVLVASWLVLGLGSAGAYRSQAGAGVIGGGLALGVVGLALLGLGGGSLFGAHGRMDAALAEEPLRRPEPREDPRAVAATAAVPFWICSDCGVVEPGLSASCTRCGNTVGFFQVGSEAERGTATASLRAV
ncbi:MAG: hypothetical protein JNL82_23560 [Myxococcales bacterium]|nr:hypothetical protein [Myxococcales bacterium]